MSAAHDHAPANFNRAFAIGISLNLAFVAIEAFYGWKVNSQALLADAGHNFSDVAGLVLAWGGAYAGKLRPDSRHTYGWKRAKILTAFADATGNNRDEPRFFSRLSNRIGVAYSFCKLLPADHDYFLSRNHLRCCGQFVIL